MSRCRIEAGLTRVIIKFKGKVVKGKTRDLLNLALMSLWVRSPFFPNIVSDSYILCIKKKKNYE